MLALRWNLSNFRLAEVELDCIEAAIGDDYLLLVVICNFIKVFGNTLEVKNSRLGGKFARTETVDRVLN